MARKNALAVDGEIIPPKDERRVRAGRARAAALSPQERSEIARKAANSRWNRVSDPQETVEGDLFAPSADEEIEVSPTMPVARWRGVLNIVGIDVPCYVLDDGSRVIGRISATEVLTGRKGHGDLDQLLGVRSLEPFIDREAITARFIPFRHPDVDRLGTAVKGLPADLFIEICQAFVAALKASFDPASTLPKMTERQRQMGIQASVFLSACARLGLEALIDEATGYQFERPDDALQVKLRAFIADELRAWEKTFPDELWLEFGRLTGWRDPLYQRPKWWGKLVIEMIYDTQDPDVAQYLKDNKPPPGIHWHRQLTENIGVRALVSRCYEVIGMAKSCRTIGELRDKVARHYGRRIYQFSLALPVPHGAE